jgi:hypothetical protein
MGIILVRNYVKADHLVQTLRGEETGTLTTHISTMIF